MRCSTSPSSLTLLVRISSELNHLEWAPRRAIISRPRHLDEALTVGGGVSARVEKQLPLVLDE